MPFLESLEHSAQIAWSSVARQRNCADCGSKNWDTSRTPSVLAEQEDHYSPLETMS
ncbi:hypothetical protein HY496_03155 [Candidatus Woesearchaeota archaeon]|nr:hypothetical protein [Candidatus Woesearchaeota archaeon]